MYVTDWNGYWEFQFEQRNGDIPQGRTSGSQVRLGLFGSEPCLQVKTVGLAYTYPDDSRTKHFRVRTVVLGPDALLAPVPHSARDQIGESWPSADASTAGH